jgi:hypothetical protein
MKIVFISACLLVAASAEVIHSGTVQGVTQDPEGLPLAAVQVAICNVNENTPVTAISGDDGTFLVANLKPGKYQITAKADGYET